MRYASTCGCLPEPALRSARSLSSTGWACSSSFCGARRLCARVGLLGTPHPLFVAVQAQGWQGRWFRPGSRVAGRKSATPRDPANPVQAHHLSAPQPSRCCMPPPRCLRPDASPRAAPETRWLLTYRPWPLRAGRTRSAGRLSQMFWHYRRPSPESMQNPSSLL